MSRVLFLAPWYWDRQDPDQAEPILPASLVKQTHKDWRLLMLYDGDEIPPETVGPWNLDERVTYESGGPRKGYWGHPLRQKMLQRVRDDGIECDFILNTNPDNYYVPTFCADMVTHMPEHCVAAFCDMAHNYYRYRPIPCRLALGWIDCGNFMVRREIAMETGWPMIRRNADWDMIDRVARRYPGQFAGLPMSLFVHN